jgi:2-polyprenyl-6-methoxyphenol hydroxylase-like FAD-dependent oxidoreductase
LRERVRQLGGTIERGVELVRLAENGSAVDVTLRDATGGEIEISSDYVVGCDGAHSRVRHELGLPFEGQPMRGTGCSPTSHWTAQAATTPCTSSSGRTGCP